MAYFADISRPMHGSDRALIMGIVNAAPDSFSDGNDGENPLDKALRLLDEGADIIDIGGESTRPGADEISSDIEIRRVMQFLPQLRKMRPDACISIDTRKSVCAKVFLDSGADIINDVSGLAYSEDMAETVASFNAGLIIMHSYAKGISDTEHEYDNIIAEVGDFLKKQFDFAASCGVDAKKIVIDPGIGFSKNTEENFALLKNISEFKKIAPVLIGHSRKRFIREFMNIENAADSDDASALVSVLAYQNGADILRVHNVKKTAKFLSLANKIRSF